VARRVANHKLAAHAPSTLAKIRQVRVSGGRSSINSYRLTFRLLNPDGLAPTVTASGFRDLIHPSEDRFLTTRELARLQGFPDKHIFVGHRLDSYSSKRNAPLCQIAQIGNAVPPPLAEALARSVRSQLFRDPSDFVDLRASKRLHRIVQLLCETYPPSRLGNKARPVDELVYILLSRQTSEIQYQEGFRVFRHMFPRWEYILSAPEKEVVRALEPLGLARQKTRALKAALGKIMADFGRITLAPLRRWPTWKALNYLTSLLGIDEKSAKCVLMYCFGRRVLPVDTHTLRVSRRLGIIRIDVPEWSAAQWLELAVPPELRFDYHVKCVQHGRAVCLSRRPLCSQCTIRRYCRQIGVSQSS